MDRLQVPGVALGVLHGDQEFTAAFGVTSVENPLPVDADTLFQIGSTTKTITGTIAMRLVEQGKINLEPFITQRIQLDDLVSQGFETLIHNNESAVKIIVHP